jgi:hypothetical protein
MERTFSSLACAWFTPAQLTSATRAIGAQSRTGFPNLAPAMLESNNEGSTQAQEQGAKMVNRPQQA